MIKGFIKEIGYDKPFKTGEPFDQTYDDSFGKMDIDVPLRGRDGHFEVRAGQVPWLPEGEALRHPGWAHGQAAAKGKAGDSVIYRFVQV